MKNLLKVFPFIVMLVTSCSADKGIHKQTVLNVVDKLDTSAFKLSCIYIGAKANKVDRFIEFAKKHGLNAFVVDIKNDHGELTCDLGVKDLPYNKEIKDIKSFLTKCNENGIYTIARIVAFKDKIKTESDPEMAILNLDGSVHVDKENMRWLNPYNKAARDYVIRIAKLTAQLGFDEIQFDYIRLPHYNKSVQETNIKNCVDKESKVQVINRFLKEAVSEIHKLGKKVSVDVFGCTIPGSLPNDDVKISQKNLGQDYIAIAQIADYICPMIYPSHWPTQSFKIKFPDLEPYKVVLHAMNLSNKALGDNYKKVRPWIQAFSATWLQNGAWKAYGITELQQQIDATKDNYLNEFSLWNPSAKYSFHSKERSNNRNQRTCYKRCS